MQQRRDLQSRRGWRLRQKHGAEFAGTYQADTNRISGCGMGGQILINKHALLFRCVLTFGDEIDKTFVVKSFDRGKVAMGDPFFAIKGPGVIIDPAK